MSTVPALKRETRLMRLMRLIRVAGSSSRVAYGYAITSVRDTQQDSREDGNDESAAQEAPKLSPYTLSPARVIDGALAATATDGLGATPCPDSPSTSAWAPCPSTVTSKTRTI